MEQSFVAWAKMRARRLPQVRLGIGDDAAVLEQCDEATVITSDTLMEGVHFESDKVTLERIGRKLVSVNLSDLAAMAAEPVAIFLSMSLPTKVDKPADLIAAEVYEGVCAAAEEFQVALAGGDTNCWDGPLVLNLTAVGKTVDGVVWTRSGATPDDLIAVTGPLGGSIQGKHLDFSPRLDIVERLRAAGCVAVDTIHAAMDISDGLSVDLLRMCDASSCGAVLEIDQIPVTDVAQELSKSSGKSGAEHAVGDGEDFELLLAIPPEKFSQVEGVLGEGNLFRCGVFTSRTGLWMRSGGKILQMTASGYVHGGTLE